MTDSKLNQAILDTLKDLLKWTKITAYGDVKKILESTLDSEIKRTIYYLSDGENNQDDIVDKGNVGAGTVSKYWKEWEKIGIGESIPVKRGTRFKRIFALEDFGIEIPKIELKKKENEKR